MHLLCTSVLDRTSLVKSCLKRPKKKKRHLQHSCFWSCKCSLKVNQTSPADPNVLSRMLWTIKYAFNPAIRIATMVAAIRVSHRFTKLPILARELVKWTKGTTAKMRVKKRITWLRTSNFPAAAFPPTAATIAAGMIAMERVSNLRSQGLIRIWRKPSMTTCPASVPMMVEFWPLASRATPKRILAAWLPSAGASSL